MDDIDRVYEDIRMGLRCQTMQEGVAGDGLQWPEVRDTDG